MTDAAWTSREILTLTLTLAAIILGPILAVQAQKSIERVRDTRARRMHLFRVLMATRAAPLSPGHVEALNTVDVEYFGVEPVVTAWRTYHDHLSHFPQPTPEGQPPSDAELVAWGARLPDLLADLLFEMGSHLRLRIDRLALKRAAYIPRAYFEIEKEQAEIRRGLATLLSKGVLPVVDATAMLRELAKRKNDPPAGGSAPPSSGAETT